MSRLAACGPAGPWVLGALLLVMAACGGAGGPRSGGSLTADRILQEEIAASSTTNAYDLVSRLRPNWLRGRGAPSLSGGPDLPVVYLEDRRQGGIEVLRTFANTNLRELRFINATTATTRYGEGHAGGVIQVIPKER